MADPSDKVSAAARRDLDRLAREGESITSSAMQAGAPDQAPPEDDIERLGKRIGRGLAYVALPIALYVFGRSANWW